MRGDAERVETLILGAGPTGLGAGERLLREGGQDFLVLEASPTIGGLSRTIIDGGYRWDLGGHVIFSHYAHFDELFDRYLGDAHSLIERESWVRCAGTWVPYPFQNNTRYLPEAEARACVEDLERAQARGGAADADNFGAFIDSAFGQSISRLFMRPYNEKVWGCPPETLAKEWIGQRVATIDAARARRNLEKSLDDFGWGPNNRFRYPLDGAGAMYAAIGRALGDRLRLGARATAIDPAEHVVTLADGGRVRYDRLLSTMPLDVLIRDVIGDAAPDTVRDAAARLVHSSGHFVGVGIRQPCPSPRSWMYFPGDECPFYRVTYLSNYSPRMAPEGCYSLLCEITESASHPVDADRIVEETIRGLQAVELLAPGERDDIDRLWHARVEHAYPTPTLERDAILETVHPWLESNGIASRGRFGMWKYEVANTDHSVMQGVEWAERELHGTPETTIGLRYEPGDDGRLVAASVRPDAAGSGERRR